MEGESCAVTAIVEGTFYCGILDHAFKSDGIINVASSNSASTLSVNFGVGATPGTKTVGSGGSLSFQAQSDTKIWIAAELVGTGTLTFTTLTATSATGSFSFNAQPASGGATLVKSVTNGSFSVTF